MSSDECRWVDVGPATGFPDGQGTPVRIGARQLAVFRDGDRLACLKDRCAHAGRPLAGGRIVDGCAVCPAHGWRFALADGSGPDGCRVSTWPVRVRDGRVEVGV